MLIMRIFDATSIFTEESECRIPLMIIVRTAASASQNALLVRFLKRETNVQSMLMNVQNAAFVRLYVRPMR